MLVRLLSEHFKRPAVHDGADGYILSVESACGVPMRLRLALSGRRFQLSDLGLFVDYGVNGFDEAVGAIEVLRQTARTFDGSARRQPTVAELREAQGQYTGPFGPGSGAARWNGGGLR